jgi:hypothetical protein
MATMASWVETRVVAAGKENINPQAIVFVASQNPQRAQLRCMATKLLLGLGAITGELGKSRRLAQKPSLYAC